MSETHKLGIDVDTCDAKKLKGRLKKLKSTASIEGPYIYHQDVGYAQLHLETTMTEAELDNWLYTTKHGCGYVGVFVGAFSSDNI
jgi:hypothetical protein